MYINYQIHQSKSIVKSIIFFVGTNIV